MRILNHALLMLLLALVMGCQTVQPPQPPPKPQRSVTGEVSYKEHIRLPPGAVLAIQLVSVNPGGTETSVLTERRFVNVQVPFPYQIFSPSGQNVANTDLAVRAFISVRGEIWFNSARLFPAPADKDPAHVDIWLQSQLVPIEPEKDAKDAKGAK